MEKVKSYKDLIVYQKSLDLVLEVHEITRTLPDDERYGLVSQMRKAAVNIPLNIAEGFKRKSINDYVRFLSIASESVVELETRIELCKKIYNYYDFSKADRLLEEVKKELNR